MSDLKECPFCGGDVDPEGWLDGKGVRGPECEACGATALTMTIWNTRATAPARLVELVRNYFFLLDDEGDISVGQCMAIDDLENEMRSLVKERP